VITWYGVFESVVRKVGMMQAERHVREAPALRSAAVDGRTSISAFSFTEILVPTSACRPARPPGDRRQVGVTWEED